MNEKWKILINKFEAWGYEPEDIHMRVYFYDTMVGIHERTVKFYEDEKNERDDSD